MREHLLGYVLDAVEPDEPRILKSIWPKMNRCAATPNCFVPVCSPWRMMPSIICRRPDWPGSVAIMCFRA